MIALTRGKVLGKKFKSAKCSAFRAVAHTQQEEVEKCTDTAGTSLTVFRTRGQIGGTKA